MHFETTIDQRISVLKKSMDTNKKELKENIDLVWDQIEMNTKLELQERDVVWNSINKLNMDLKR